MTAPATAKKRILIAEDDRAIAEMLARALRDTYDVAVAPDGPGAVAILSHKPLPDLVVLDLMMPGIDGFGVAERLKILHPQHKVPIIFLTARSAPQDVISGIQHGARHYITKPFKLSDVLAKIKGILGT